MLSRKLNFVPILLLFCFLVFGLLPCKVEASSREQVRIIIHGAATAAASAAAGMAQAPGSDNLVITPIQVAMIISIGEVYGKELTKSGALVVLAEASTSSIGRTISQVFVGWIPGYGNAINASTAFAVTEAVGWAANKILSEE